MSFATARTRPTPASSGSRGGCSGGRQSMATTPDTAARVLSSRHADVVVAPAIRDAAPPEAAYGGLVTRAIASAIDALLINLAAVAVAAVVALVLSIFPVSSEMKKVLAA